MDKSSIIQDIKMKNHFVLVLILAVLCLVGCAKENLNKDIEISDMDALEHLFSYLYPNREEICM